MDAETLRRRRKATGLTQADFAEAIGVSRNRLGQMERGQASIKPGTAAMVRALSGQPGPDAAAPPVLKTTDPMERLVEAALHESGIAFEADRDGDGRYGLDFYLADYGVAIEVKRFHSDRIAEQMSRAPNVIALQGVDAVRLFCALLARRAALPD